MKKIKLFALAAAALFAGSLSAQTPLLSYEVQEGVTVEKQEIPLENGSIYFGADKKLETKNGLFGYKLDGDSGTKFVRVTLTGGYQPGDVITITGFATSNGSGLKLCTATNTEVATRPFSEKNALEEMVYTVQAGDGIAGETQFTIWRNSVSCYFRSVSISRVAATDDATLKNITVNGTALEGFDAATLSYDVELPFGTTEVPVVAGVANSDKAIVAVAQATALPSTATITVTAEDGTTKQVYTVNFTVAAGASSNANLAHLALNGVLISGFRADSTDYAYELEYKAAIPTIDASAEDATATVEITPNPIVSLPCEVQIVVTAQDGTTTKTYTLSLTQATAPKILTEVVFANGAKGASDAETGIVRVPVVGSDEIPAITSATTNEGASAAWEGDKITVTGEDQTTFIYTIEVVNLVVPELGSDVVTFDGTETYVFAAYKWDAEKGYKFAKAVEDESNRRISSGRTRIYIALPAAKEVKLTSGSGGKRDAKFFVNGVESSSVTATAAAGEAITLPLSSAGTNFIAIESNQTKGDGGFVSLQLTPAAPTAIENATVEAAQIEKKFINGQLVIIKDGVQYNAQGARLN